MRQNSISIGEVLILISLLSAGLLTPTIPFHVFEAVPDTNGVKSASSLVLSHRPRLGNRSRALQSACWSSHCPSTVTVFVTEDGTEAGTPVVGAIVQFRHAEQPVATGVTGDEGTARMAHVPAGDFDIWVLPSREAEWQKVGEVTLPACVDVRIVIPVSPESAAPTTTATLTPIPTATALPTPVIATPEVGNLELVGRFSDRDVFMPVVQVHGDYAYVIERCTNALWIVDVSDPANPTKVGAFEGLDYPNSMQVVGHYAFIADGALRVIDVSEPTAPAEVGLVESVEEWGSANHVFVAGNYAYVVDSRALRIIDVSDAAAPRQVGSIRRPGWTWMNDVYVAGDYAYLAMGDAGLRVVDVSDPSRPLEVEGWGTQHPNKRYPVKVRVAGRYAYVLSQPSLYILDALDPTDLTEVSAYSNNYGCAPSSQYPCDLAIAVDPSSESGWRYAFVVAGLAGFEIIDVTDPTTPVRASAYVPGFPIDGADDVYPHPIDGVAVAGEYVYLAAGEQGLLVLRATLPGLITATPSITPTPSATGVATTTPTVTLTPTATPTPSTTPTPTATPTATPTPDAPLVPRIYVPYVSRNAGPSTPPVSPTPIRTGIRHRLDGHRPHANLYPDTIHDAYEHAGPVRYR